MEFEGERRKRALRQLGSCALIRTVADFLQELANAEVARLDDFNLKHGPTIGKMYEGLSADLLRRLVPEHLGLQIVEGFITDGQGVMSGQIDCMLARGTGESVPYTDSHVWPVQDVIAVFEIKKTLYHDELGDAFATLQCVKDIDRSYRISLREHSGTIDISSARRAFAETTGTVPPPYERLDELALTEQLVFHTLVGEQLSPVGVVLGYHGYATESAFRESLRKHLADQLNVLGYGPGSFPQLMISGQYSLGKANGQPYSARMQSGSWPFYFSSRVNPLVLLLEYIWTRLDLLHGIGGLWGDDLLVERVSPFLLTRAVEVDGRTGWHHEWVELDEAELAVGDDLEPWRPRFVSREQFAVLTRLCEGARVFLDDPELMQFLEESHVDPQTFASDILNTGLVAMAGSELELITDRCLAAVLPDGRLVVGEDNTGRMTRWLGNEGREHSD